MLDMLIMFLKAASIGRFRLFLLCGHKCTNETNNVSTCVLHKLFHLFYGRTITIVCDCCSCYFNLQTIYCIFYLILSKINFCCFHKKISMFSMNGLAWFNRKDRISLLVNLNEYNYIYNNI